MAMYRALDVLFFIFHSALILFILFGWIWKKTRKANLILILMTAFSWCVLGMWYGFGYCPCTEWHWQVRMTLGDYTMPLSYIKFLLDALTGCDLNAILVDWVTCVAFVLALLASVYTNLGDFRAWKAARKG